MRGMRAINQNMPPSQNECNRSQNLLNTAMKADDNDFECVAHFSYLIVLTL